MTRSDIINSVNKVISTIRKTEIYENLSAFRKMEKPDAVKLIKAFQDFSIIASRFNEADKEILRIFGLENLNQPSLLSKILENDRKMGLPLNILGNINFAMNHLPNIIKLLEREDARYFENPNIKKPKKLEDKDVLKVVLPEHQNEHSSPERVIYMLEAVRQLYKASAILNDAPENELSVLAIDSGSDKSFDFLGIAKVIEQTKEIILSLWDKIVFYRERKLGEKIELISKSLPILEKISTLEVAGALTPERAEILRRCVTEGTEKFILAGAITPEFDTYSYFNPKQLVSPEPKLLASSNTENNEINNLTEENIEEENIEEESIEEESIEEENEELSPEEQELFEKLLKKKGNKK